MCVLCQIHQRALCVSTSCDILSRSGNTAKAYLTTWVGGSTRDPLFVSRARAVFEHRTVFSVHTQNRKLADREEKFSKFDKKWQKVT